MSSPPDPDPSRSDPSGGPSRQLGLIVLCVLGLVVAAFAMPMLTDTASGGPDDEQRNGSSPIVDAIGRVLRAIGQLLDDGSSRGTGGSEWIVLDGDGPPMDGCVIAIQGQQSPGSQVLVHAWRDGEPISGLAVRFNGRPIGETDSQGTVFGRVPYRSELRVSVDRPDATCRFYRAREPTETRTAETRTAETRANETRTSAVDVTGSSLAMPGSFDGRNRLRLQADGNSTGEYTVDGAVDLEVHGEAYPGERVTVAATIEDVPMRDATVTVDGEAVGRTNGTGEYTLRVPDDGTERQLVSVSRGDFSGKAAISVRLLRVAVVPSSRFPLPGSKATIRSTFGDDERANASVRVDGEGLGETGFDGTVRYRLPADPGTNVQVRARGQVATTTLWPVYAATILGSGLLGVLLVGSHATAYRRGGRRRVGHVAAVWVALGLVVAGTMVAGRTGGLAVLGLLALAGIGTVLAGRGDEIGGSTRSIGAMIAAAVEWLLTRALRTTETLERIVEWIQGALAVLRARVAALPRSIWGVFGGVLAWVRTLPGRVRAAADGRVDARAVVAGVVALVVVTGATWYRGEEGFMASMGLLALAAIVVLIRRRSTAAVPGDREKPTTATVSPPSREAIEAVPSPTLREQWATFARWIAPGDWRTRTPGEISRAAIDRGYPREPVGQFTRIVREVEYDDRPPSADRHARASAAFEALERARHRHRHHVAEEDRP